MEYKSTKVTSGSEGQEINYIEAKAKAYKAEQANVNELMNSRKKFEQSLFTATADIFKPITQSVQVQTRIQHV